MPLALRALQRLQAASKHHRSRNPAVIITQSIISSINASLDIYQETKFFLPGMANGE
jgi:uncharacterized protein (UPF0218 family)